ncbi:IS66 family insertion sequence element accessory protein TnpA [Roseiconus lacunae]|uniref:IS66 family insertion sequence element accessory protein TnpA n=1 Tax=Roseiconus lacunae TaxID=2605694 RepID=UPI0011F39F15|nr:hypothetical protein [Roseiconus lacunae]
MPRTSCPKLTQQWRERIRRFEKSELTVADFCQLEGYSVASFYQWRRRFAEEDREDQPGVFMPVELPHAALQGHRLDEQVQAVDLRIELPGGAVLRLDAEASDRQQCRLIRNVVRSLSEVAQ